MKFLILIAILLFSSQQQLSFGQYSDTRAGSFLIRNYSSKEHGGNAQIFDIAQDTRGLMYFANQKGVLEYDGVNWNTIFIGDEARKVLAVATNQQGQILVGAEGEFGALETNSLGKLEFNSWLKSSGVDSVNSVSEIIIEGELLLIIAEDELIVLKNSKVEYRTRSNSSFSAIAVIEDVIYVGQKELGLYKVVNGKLELFDSSNFFKDKLIIDIIDFQGRTIVATMSNGLFEIVEDGKLKKIPGLEEYQIFTAQVYDSRLQLGTFSHGVVLLDASLKVKSEVGLDKGIADATVRCQFIDREDNLWVGTNIGISKISVNEPVLKYGKQAGLNSGVEAIGEFQGHLYFATQNGLYVLDSGSINKIEGLEKDCYGVRSIPFDHDTLLFIAEANEVVSLNGQGDLNVVEKGGPYDFLVSPLDSTELIVLHWDGLSKLKYKEGKFEEVRYLNDVGGASPFNFLIDPDGTIWIGSLYEEVYGVFKGHVNMFEEDNPTFQNYSADEGLPQGASFLFRYANDLYVGNDLGLFKLIDGKFKLTSDFGIDFTKNEYGVHRINSDPDGNVWMIIFDKENNYQYGFSSKTQDGFIWNSLAFKRYAEEISHAIYHESNGITWIGGPAGLLRFERNKELDYHIPFNAVIRQLKFGNEVLYFGADYSKESKEVKLEYSSNKAVGFEFAGPSFIEEESNLYSFYMEGHDETWSNWSDRTVKEYNLDYGTYTFHVKVKNVYGTVSMEDTISIVVSPPWYNTLLAYAVYVVLLLVLIYGIIRLSIYRIRQKNLQLEQTVYERTQEVVVQKEEALKQRDFAEKQTRVADRQKELVEEKNREIVDSINYAKRIQDAIMPSLAALEEALPELLLLYLPKDVIAGDFFWMEKIDDVVYYAAADCTGHGVPGAMVSVVCSNALTKALLEDDIRDTGKLLDRTREIVIEKLAKSGEEVKDGMDISLCALNTKTLNMQWSGANNPLWIIRNGSDEITETKADKQPIGLFDRFEPFTSHNIQLSKGDIVYVFTDGYQDQFGGPRGKKFKPMNIKKLLLEHRDLPMKEQHELLLKTFEEWMNDLEQIDDVCMIGLRV